MIEHSKERERKKRKRKKLKQVCFIEIYDLRSVIVNRLNENKGQADGAIMQLSYFDNNGKFERKKKK